MKNCKHCGVDVAGSRETCPLCQSGLEGKPTWERYPDIPTTYQQFHMLFRILLFATVSAAVIAVAVNLLLEGTGAWSIFVVGGVVCLWLCLSLAMKKRKNIPKGVLYQVFLVSVISIIWDVSNGWYKWSVNYVVPILCFTAMVAMAVLAKVLAWRLENMIIYFCVDGIFGIVPIIFYFAKVLTVPYPSVICTVGSIISMVAIVVFRGDRVWAELKRRMNL
jgi:hypothetical protein